MAAWGRRPDSRHGRPGMGRAGSRPECGKARSFLGTPAVFKFGGEDNQEFMLNGKPFQIRGAEMHPQRIPREYWRHRIRTARAMGLNTIAFYVFWNDHEQPDGSFDFKTGNRDLAAFLKLCQEEGMWVLFRPGPYVCGGMGPGRAASLPAERPQRPN